MVPPRKREIEGHLEERGKMDPRTCQLFKRDLEEDPEHGQEEFPTGLGKGLHHKPWGLLDLQTAPGFCGSFGMRLVCFARDGNVPLRV